MMNSGAARDVGAAIEGRLVYCEYRKAGRERLIRKTGAHRGRSTVLDNALCVIQKRYSRDSKSQSHHTDEKRFVPQE